jgi:hypothetical protein
MWKWLGRLFGAQEPVVPVADPDFGEISFFPSAPEGRVGIWQMHDAWDHRAEFAKVLCSSIPGTMEGPYPEARDFLLRKKGEIPGLWTLCAAELERARSRWPRLPGNVPLTECFVLTSLSLDEPMTQPPAWSVGFESLGSFWVHVDVQLVGDQVTGHSCDT